MPSISLLGSKGGASHDSPSVILSNWDFQRTRGILKPDTQITLTEAQLEEEIPRRLQALNPLACKNVVFFNPTLGKWVPAPPSSPAIHFVHYESYAVHKDSPESQDPLANCDAVSGARLSTIKEEEEEDNAEEGEEEEAETEHQEVVDEKGDAEKVMKTLKERKSGKKIPNAFNFYEGASQTRDLTLRHQEMQTTPSGRGVLHFNISPSIIYDAYAIDFEIQQKEKEKKALALPQPGRKVKVIKKQEVHEENRMAKILNLMDRVVYQNVCDEITFDFRYYEDPSDEYRDNNSGTLLPLWRFTHSSIRSATVTDIEWNPRYYDLFAVSFGAYVYSSHPTTGALALFTLKNSTFPEWLTVTHTAILCLSIHPRNCQLVSVGQYDGTLVIYNTAQKSGPGAILFSSSPENHNAMNHEGPIVQVRWANEPDLNLFSISKDGRVVNWRVTSTELVARTINPLGLPTRIVRGPEGAILDILARPSTFTFHPTLNDIYIVGTEDGRISKCSVLHNKGEVHVRKAHNMEVSRIAYNYFNKTVFLSCSFDWTVKIWMDSREEPLFIFDLNSPVGDAEWAPYSSTVFAAITTDGFCYVYDLNLNKSRPMCVQQVTSRIGNNHSTRLSFNRATPIIVVGDERGTLLALKMSPNLRIPPKIGKKEQANLHELELRKLLKIISYTKPDKVEAPPDKPCI